MRTSVRMIGLLGVAALVVAACGDDDDNGGATETTAGVTTAAPATSSAPTSGAPATSAAAPTTAEAATTSAAPKCTEPTGELVYGNLTWPRGFDPLLGGSVGTQGGTEKAAVFDTLTQYDSETGEYLPRLAESLEPNADFTEWTMKLREGVTFTSGEPLTTEAVQFSIDRHRDPKSISPLRGVASTIESMEIVDDTTMVFHLTAPLGTFGSVLAGGVGMIIDPKTFQELGTDAFNLDPKGGGAGPYTVTRHAVNEEIILEAKKDYWGGTPCIKTIRFVNVVASAGRYDSFNNGELDVAFFRDPVNLKKAEDAGTGMHTEVSNGADLILVNNGARGVDRPGKDLRVRQAIAYAIDPEVLNQRVYGGAGEATSGLLSKDSILYTPEMVGPPYDPAKAKQLLDQVKAETGYDGQIHLLCAQTPEHVERSIAIQGMLEAVGFVVRRDNPAPSVGGIVSDTADYDAACFALSMTDAQPWNALQRVLSNGDLPTSYVGYINPEADAALAKLKAASTVEEQQKEMVAIQKIWNDTIPSEVITHFPLGAIWNEKVDGLTFGLESIVYLDKATIKS